MKRAAKQVATQSETKAKEQGKKRKSVEMPEKEATTKKAKKGEASEMRRSAREKKVPASYSEDAIFKELEQVHERKIASGLSYRALMDPPGMKSTAYVCKHPFARPPEAQVLSDRMPLPKRNARGEFEFADHPDFRPNLSPSEIIKDGGEEYVDAHKEFPSDWFKGVPANAVTSPKYNPEINKWKVECGGALDMWESSGWITEIDPYGWFQWYCRFFLGRRSSDDQRQISRWSGVAGKKGRFRNQLINKVMASGCSHDDPNISPVIRQTLHHWAYDLTSQDCNSFKKGR